MAGIKPKQNEDATSKAIKTLLNPSQRPENPKVRQEAEFELQCACHEYMQLQYPNLYCFHIPNERKVKTYGKKKIPIEGAKLKRAGVKKGNPDYWILQPFTTANGKYYIGTVIELKAPGKLANTSIEQKQCIRDLRTIGYFVEVIDSLSDFISTVDKIYNNLKRKQWHG